MSQAFAVVEQPPNEPMRTLQRTRPVVWVACFDGADSLELARLLADAHFDVRVLSEQDRRAEILYAPELAVFDGERASDHDWIVALRVHRSGTRVVVRFDHGSSEWFGWYFAVLEGGPSLVSIVDATVRSSRFGPWSEGNRR